MKERETLLTGSPGSPGGPWKHIMCFGYLLVHDFVASWWNVFWRVPVSYCQKYNLQIVSFLKKHCFCEAAAVTFTLKLIVTHFCSKVSKNICTCIPSGPLMPGSPLKPSPEPSMSSFKYKRTIFPSPIFQIIYCSDQYSMEFILYLSFTSLRLFCMVMIFKYTNMHSVIKIFIHVSHIAGAEN